jgi:hypothetical protein
MSEAERTDVAIQWIERAPFLHEARVTTADGADLYAGYVATTPSADIWRGYVGREFIPLGMGPRGVMQAAVEERVRELMAQGEKGVSHHAS